MLKRPFAIIISWVPVKVPALCHHDFLGARKGYGGKETLCHHDFLVPVKVPALKRPFAIMIGCDLLVPVDRFRR